LLQLSLTPLIVGGAHIDCRMLNGLGIPFCRRYPPAKALQTQASLPGVAKSTHGPRLLVGYEHDGQAISSGNSIYRTTVPQEKRRAFCFANKIKRFT